MSTEPTTHAAVHTLPHPDVDGETTVVAEGEAETVVAAPALPVIKTDAPRVDAFIREHNLGAWVDAAVRLFPEFFPEAVGVHIHMSHDAPGEYGEGVFVEARLPPAASDVVRRRWQLLRRWVRATPAWVGDVMCVSTESV